MKDATDHGGATEDAVEQLCHLMFLRDFTVRSPKFRKRDGQEREAADVLVPFDDHLLAFQVKSKEEAKPATAKDRKDFKRIERRVEEGVDQVRTVQVALKDGLLTTLRNAAGVEIPFQADRVKEVAGVVVLNLVGEEQFSPEDRTYMGGGFTVRNGVPIHMFMLEELQAIATEIDTLPDFLEYLTTRRVVFERRILAPLTEEVDFLAAYKTMPDKIQDAIEGKYDMLTILPGTWDGYRKDESGRIKRRANLNAPSYLVDKVIEALHSSVGQPLTVADAPGLETGGPGEASAYWATIFALARLPRLGRRTLGEKMIEKMEKADRLGLGYAVQVNPDRPEGILFLATTETREERLRRLHMLCSIAYCHYDLTQIVGIATQGKRSDVRSFECLGFKDATFSNAAELRARAKDFFRGGTRTRIYEYTDEEHPVPESGSPESSGGGGASRRKRRRLRKASKRLRNRACPCGSERRFKRCCFYTANRGRALQAFRHMASE